MKTRNNSKLSRRAFLKKVGAGAAMLVGAQLLMAENVYASGGACKCECECEYPGILMDLTRCIGCPSCTLACRTVNNLPDGPRKPQALGSGTYTRIEDHQVTTVDGIVKTRHVKRQCMHCLHAACVAACPTAAMYQSELGPVIYRSVRCMGCRYCQMACPFGIPCFEWDNGTTPVISKCWLCYERLQQDIMPGCVESCPTGALRFGQRDKLLIQAHAQITTHSHRYVDHVFGEHEVGGTSMLYLSDIPFEELGFPTDLPHTATPEGTEKILGKIPLVLFGMATLMGGTAAYTHRKPAVSQSAGETKVNEQDHVSPLPLSQGPQADQPEE